MLGWTGLGWAGLGWWGVGALFSLENTNELGWAGLGWPGLAWPGLAGLGWAGLGWAAWLGWVGLGCWAAGLGCVSNPETEIGLFENGGWFIRDWTARLLGCWAAGLGCVSNPETEIGLFENETEVGLFENGKLRLHGKKKLPDGQQQQAISIYFFLEGLGFRV